MARPADRLTENPIGLNDRVLDAFLRHQIFMLRFAGGLRNRYVDMINETDVAVLGILLQQFGRINQTNLAANRTRVENLIQRIVQERQDMWARIIQDWRAELRTLARMQTEFLPATFQQLSPTDLGLLPVSAIGVVSSIVFNGRNLSGWFRNIRNFDTGIVATSLRQSAVQGHGPRQAATQLLGSRRLQGRNGRLQRSRNHIATVTRSSVIATATEINNRFGLANAHVIDQELYVATLDGLTSAICIGLDGNIYDVGVGPMPPVHINCLLGDTHILTSDRVSAASHRRYKGQVIVIRSASGHEITCTPNHPILTDIGWLPAKLVNQSRRVVRLTSSQLPFNPVEVEPQNAVSTVEEIAHAFRKTGQENFIQSAASHFHGDGMSNGEVSVIFADSSLKAIKNHATPFHHFEEFGLKIRNGIEKALFSFSPFDTLIIANNSANSGLVSSFYLTASCRSRSISPNAPASICGFLPFFGSRPPEVRSRFSISDSTIPIDKLVNDEFATTQACADIFNRFPGQVAFDDVTFVGNHEFSGHVYNLETDSGYYAANGLITHNCRSVRVPNIDPEAIQARPAVPVVRRRALRDFLVENNLPRSIRSRNGLPRGFKGRFDNFLRDRVRQATGQAVPANINYSQWLARQTRQFQDDVLGRTRARLFRDGNLQLDRLTEEGGRRFSLFELARRDRQAFIDAGLDPDNPAWERYLRAANPA